MELFHTIIVLIFLPIFSHCFDLLPMSCNVSVTDSCPATLYYSPQGPEHPGNAEEVAIMFNVLPSAVRRTVDGFLVAVTCGCPADHREFVWDTAYSVHPRDTWKVIGERFGLLVMEKPEKELFAMTTVTLDFLCGCVRGAEVVTYVIRPGDTLYDIQLRFRVTMDKLIRLNNVTDPALIYAGDRLFIPATGLNQLIVYDKNGSNAEQPFKSRIPIPLGVSIAASVIVILLVILFWRYCRRKGKTTLEASPKGSKSSKLSPAYFSGFSKSSSELSSHSSSKASTTLSKSVKKIVFHYSEVSAATSNFSESQKVGQGSYGSVYRGKLRGVVVAVKQMKDAKSKEFFVELNVLCKVYHKNLIELIGYSAGAQSLFLVYEFAQNGSLGEHLHNPAVKDHKPLSWTLRVQIALDAAKGLEHIHVHVKPFYVHRDVKTSNILLDSNFHAKIADFGLAKLLEHSPEIGAATSKIVGTFGYLAPE